MNSAGQLIWASCRPLIRLMLCVAGGFILTKTDNFPPVAARGAGKIALNIALPCLMFSKIVPAFTTDNIHALGEKGPLMLVAILYEAIGFLMAWIIKQFFWVPHRFRHGFLVAGGWGNVGDIPTSVIVSVTGAAPFDGAVDPNLSIAYISAFLLIFMVTLFPMGGNRLIALDFVGPDVEQEKVKEAVRHRRQAFLLAVSNAISRLTRRHRLDIAEKAGELADVEKSRLSTSIETLTSRHLSTFPGDFSPDDVRLPVYELTPTQAGFGPPAIVSPGSTVMGGEIPISNRKAVEHENFPTTNTGPPQLNSNPNDTFDTSPASSTVFKHSLRVLQSFASSLLTPASVVILLSFPIALIPPLKGLFVALPASNSTSTFENPHIPPGPDGLPPLSIILDTVTFIGGASIPLGLICLGSALAHLKIPLNQWGTLPIGAITSLAIGKMLITPILGVGIVQGLVKGGMISEDDKLLRFVCIFFSCLPTATTQVYLTQIFSGTGSADHLPAFLIPQYILMLFSMTALTAYSLHLLF